MWLVFVFYSKWLCFLHYLLMDSSINPLFINLLLLDEYWILPSEISLIQLCKRSYDMLRAVSFFDHLMVHISVRGNQVLFYRWLRALLLVRCKGVFKCHFSACRCIALILLIKFLSISLTVLLHFYFIDIVISLIKY